MGTIFKHYECTKPSVSSKTGKAQRVFVKPAQCERPGCRHTWDYWVAWQEAGRRRRKRAGRDLRVAGELLKGLEANVIKKESLNIVEDTKRSFADFVDKDWAPRCLPHMTERTAERWRSILRIHLKPFFAGPLRLISVSRVEHYVSKRAQAGAAPATIHGEVRVLSHILRRAVSWEFLARNPLVDGQGASRLKPIKLPRGRTRFLSHDEIHRLLVEARRCRSPYVRPFLIVALNTGMRRGEILSLTRKSVDWERRTAFLEHTKNGESRMVHLNAEAFAALKSLPVRIDGKLFPFKEPNIISHDVAAVLKRAKIEGATLHSLRHTFASYHAMAGMNQRGLMGLLGHKDSRMTTRYSHLSEEFLKEAVENLNLGGESPDKERAQG